MNTTGIIDPGQIDPDEEPIPLEGESSAEQAEWADDEQKLSFEDRRTIPQQRAFWLADYFLKYDDESTEKYAIAGNPVRTFFEGKRSAHPILFTIELRGAKLSLEEKTAFETRFAACIEDGPSSWKWTWGKSVAKIRRVS
jgi:hypothetical protein